VSAAAILLAGTLAAAMAMHQAAVAYWRGRDPQDAPGILFGDPLLRAYVNDALLDQQRAEPQAAAKIEAAARVALRRSPLEPGLLRQLAELAFLHNDPAAADRYLTMAETVWRRDLKLQRALIRYYANRGNLSASLVHYDRGLTVFVDAAPELYPALADIMRREDGQRELSRYANRPWFVPFLVEQLNHGAAAVDLTGFVDRVRPVLPREDAEKVGSAMLGQLLRTRQYASAAAWLRHSWPGLAPALTRVAVSRLTTDPHLGPLAWTFPPREGVEVTQEVGGALAIALDPGRRDTAAERQTILSPGSYELEVSLVATPGAGRAQLTIDVVCRGKGAETPLAHLSPAPGNAAARIPFAVTATCPLQHWTVIGSSGDSQNRTEVVLKGMTLTTITPANARPDGLSAKLPVRPDDRA